jgi:hypothetical protein
MNGKNMRAILAIICIASTIGALIYSYPATAFAQAQLRLTSSSGATPLPESLPYDVTPISPAPNATDVSLGTTIIVSWTRAPPIAELRLTPEVPIADRTSEGSIIDGERYIWHLSQPLQPSTTYRVTITFGEENNTRSDSWGFTTIASQSTSFPLNSLLGVAIIAAIVVVLVVAVVVFRRKCS